MHNQVLSNQLEINAKNDFIAFLFENDFKAILPESFVVLTSLVLLVYGVIYTGRKQNKYPILIENVALLTQLAFFFTILLYHNSAITKAVIFYNSLVIDESTLFLKLLVLIAAFLTVSISLQYIQEESMNCFEYMILVLISTSSMLFLISAADFISMYLAIELQSLCFYVMAALKRDSEFSTEAGVKYFLLGAFSSGILLFGCSLIYGFTGVTNFSELATILTSGGEDLLMTFSSLRACELGILFILVAFLFKLTAVPFHMWAPDVYEGAPTAVTAFFSIVPKTAILAVFMRLFLSSFYDLLFSWQGVLVFSSLASMVAGSLAALSQNKIKRLLAFSSIAHIGYILVGFCCGTVEGIQALLVYLVVYIVMTTSLFAVILSTLRRELIPASQQGHTGLKRVKYTTDLAMLGKTNPLLAISLTITMFSIAGIPPLAGFYSKAFLMFAAVSASQYVLALVAVLTSVLSCFYYIRIVKIMYFQVPNDWSSFTTLSKSTAIVLGLSFAFLLFFFLYPAPLFLVTHKVALSLCF